MPTKSHQKILYQNFKTFKNHQKPIINIHRVGWWPSRRFFPEAADFSACNPGIMYGMQGLQGLATIHSLVWRTWKIHWSVRKVCSRGWPHQCPYRIKQTSSCIILQSAPFRSTFSLVITLSWRGLLRALGLNAQVLWSLINFRMS